MTTMNQTTLDEFEKLLASVTQLAADLGKNFNEAAQAIAKMVSASEKLAPIQDDIAQIKTGLNELGKSGSSVTVTAKFWDVGLGIFSGMVANSISKAINDSGGFLQSAGKLLTKAQSGFVNVWEKLSGLSLGGDPALGKRAQEMVALAKSTNIAAVATSKWGKALNILKKIGKFGGIIGLLGIIGDFISYLQGGESALESFWAIFGTGEEIMAVLSSIFQTITEYASCLFPILVNGFTWLWACFGDAVKSFFELFKNIFQGIIAIFTGDFDAAAEHFKDALQNLVKLIINFLAGILKMCGSIIEAIVSYFANLFSGVIGFFKGLFSSDKNKKEQPISETISLVDQAIKYTAQGVLDTGVGDGGAYAMAGVSPSITGGQVDNSKHSNVNVGGITVNAQSNDPAGIARETRWELENLTDAGNRAVV